MNPTGIIFGFIMFIFLTGCANDTSQQLKGFSNYLEDLGYSFYNPPRTDRGPSSVFRFKHTESGKKVVFPVCKQLFQHVPATSAGLTIPSESSTDQFNVNFSASLIQDLLSETPKIDAEWASKEAIEVEFSRVSALSISEEDMYNEEGHSRTITPQCYAVLKKLSDNGELKDNVFIVQESVRVDSMKYTAKKLNTGGVDAQFPLKKLIKIKPEVDFIFKNDNTLIINEPRYVAFRAFLLTDYNITGLTGPGSAVVKSKPLTLKDIKMRLGE